MRVVVTGIGLVCPAGVGLEAALTRLAQGPLVPTVAEGAEGQALPEPRVLTIPEPFDPRPFLKRRKDRKLMARANELAVVAAKLALEMAGLDGDLSAGGLFLGVGREPGNLDDILPVLAHSAVQGRVDLGRLVAEGMDRMNPLSSLKTLPNMSLAHVAINLGLMGAGAALCDGPESGLRALVEAAEAVGAGRVPWALAGAADARTAFTDRTTALRLGQTGVLGEAAALFVLESEESAKARNAKIFGQVIPGEGGRNLEVVALGDCGAATDVVALALSLGQRRGGRSGCVEILSPHSARRVPSIRVREARIEVAITGVGAVTPLGDAFAEFTARLLAGESAVGPIQAFDARGFPVANACEARREIPLPSPLAELMAGLDDRKGELALAAALAAWADHGAVPSSAGLIHATGLSSVSLLELEQDSLPFLKENGAFDYFAFAAAKPLTRPQAPLRHLVSRPIELLTRHLDLRGPTACHFSACAAGAAAIAHAAELIRRGEAEVMLAGGADSMVHPFGLLPFILLGATTPERDPRRAGRPFEADRDGFVMGEGGAYFVLEPLERARAAGRRVYGVVRGAGSSCDAWNVTAPHPEGLGAEAAMRAALKDAGVAAETVDYVNAHGTGTPLNDGVEVAAIRRVFGSHRPAVSSSKAQFGHTIAAAGAVELLACLAAFAGGRLPPNAHLSAPDPSLDIDLVAADGRAGSPGIILSNSFGFGGQNACLVLGHPDLGRERSA